MKNEYFTRLYIQVTFTKIYPRFQRDKKGLIHTNCSKFDLALLGQWSYEQHFVFSGLDFPQNNWQAAALSLLLSLSAVQEGLQRKMMLPCYLHTLLWADYHSH